MRWQRCRVKVIFQWCSCVISCVFDISSVTAMVFAPTSIGANFVVNSAFSGVGTAGATGFIAQFAVDFAMGGNISILQAIIDMF